MLRFEEARKSKIVPQCKRFRKGDKYRLYGKNTIETCVAVVGTKPEEREIHVFDGDVLLGRIIHIAPEKVQTPSYNKKGEGEWARQHKGSFGFAKPEYAERFCGSILDAKRECEKFFRKELEDEVNRDLPRRKAGAKRIPVQALPFGDSVEFFPTPKALAGRMIGKINWRHVNTILEPSAGKGDIVAALSECSHTWKSVLYNQYDSDGIYKKIDCIELDPNLQALLKGLGYRVVADDFLTFHTYKKYDAIIMNPPFSDGDAHLLKAIELQEQNGGQICCLLNADTIRIPYTRRRKELLQKLDQYGAQYEYVKNGFRHAERTSDVETVIIWLTVPEPPAKSRIVDFLKKAPKYTGEYSPTALMEKGDFVRELIQRYNFEADVIFRILKEYQGLLPCLEPSPNGYDSAIITVSVGKNSKGTTKVNTETINDALESLREHFWHKLLHDPQLEPTIGKMTDNILREYDSKIHEMRDRDFTEYNIRMLLLDIQSQLCQGIEDEIMRLFREMTSHAIYDGCENVHYYDGWKTNKAYKVNMKVILPFYSAFGSYSWDKTDKLDECNVSRYLSDLIKVMDYLDRGETSMSMDLMREIRCANVGNGRRKVHTKYFDATFYKKGTAHICFHDSAKHIIDRLNIFAATHQKNGQNWLPPYFGSVRYDDMDEEGKAVIDSFYSDIEDPAARRAEYEKVCQNPDYYLTTIDSSSIPLLSDGQ